MDSFEETAPGVVRLLFGSPDFTTLEPHDNTPELGPYRPIVLGATTIVDRSRLKPFKVFDRRVGTVIPHQYLQYADQLSLAIERGIRKAGIGLDPVAPKGIL